MSHATLGLSYYEPHQPGLYHVEVRQSLPSGTPREQRAAFMTELRGVRARIEGDIHSASLSLPDGSVSASLFQQGGEWVLQGYAKRHRMVREVLS